MYWGWCSRCLLPATVNLNLERRRAHQPPPCRLWSAIGRTWRHWTGALYGGTSTIATRSWDSRVEAIHGRILGAAGGSLHAPKLLWYSWHQLAKLTVKKHVAIAITMSATGGAQCNPIHIPFVKRQNNRLFECRYVFLFLFLRQSEVYQILHFSDFKPLEIWLDSRERAS